MKFAVRVGISYPELLGVTNNSWLSIRHGWLASIICCSILFFPSTFPQNNLFKENENRNPGNYVLSSLRTLLMWPWKECLCPILSKLWQTCFHTSLYRIYGRKRNFGNTPRTHLRASYIMHKDGRSLPTYRAKKYLRIKTYAYTLWQSV